MLPPNDIALDVEVLGDTGIFGADGLSGTLPTTIGALTDLTYLNLCMYQVRGMFHLAYIDDLCSLTCVSFFNIIGLNSLSGTIPELPLSLEEPACLLGMCHYIRLSISSSRRLLST